MNKTVGLAHHVAVFLTDLKNKRDARLIDIRNKSEMDGYTIVENNPSELFKYMNASEIISFLDGCDYASWEEYALLCNGQLENTIPADDLYYDFSCDWILNITKLARHITENDLFEKCGLSKEYILANY